MSMFMPFGGLSGASETSDGDKAASGKSASADEGDLDKMKKQLAEMQAQLKALDGKK